MKNEKKKPNPTSILPANVIQQVKRKAEKEPDAMQRLEAQNR